MTSPAERNLASEARAIEAGLRAHTTTDSPAAHTVRSDTYRGKTYRVAHQAAGDHIMFTCHPEDGTRAAYQDDHLYITGMPGELPCMHSAAVARRLEREGQAKLDTDGRWLAAGALAPKPFDGDPFTGLV